VKGRYLGRLRIRTGPDDGVTLMEMVVAMTITAMFMAMFTTAIVQIYGVLDRSDATSTVQAQLNIAFLRLDGELRYAAGITTPGLGSAGSTDWYVEYLNTGTSTCSQLRLHLAPGDTTRSLQWRSWTSAGSPPPGWITLASGLTATTPFTVLPADATSDFVRLELTVTAQSGSGRTGTSRLTDVTFAALNSRPPTDPQTGELVPVDPSVCIQGR
jgi:prepilin-type N-terminal cleavage/methylation domain-containing protein